MPYCVLVIEDNEKLREIIRDYFHAADFSVDEAPDGHRALEWLDSRRYDAVLLDIMMPGLDGYAVCRHIRAQKSLSSNGDVPILFLTALGSEQDILRGYALGADDYVVKPFSLPVLVAKVRQLIKRAAGLSADADVLRFDGLTIDRRARVVTVDGQPVELAARPYELLLYLTMNQGIVLSRGQILDALWGAAYEGSDRVVDTQVKLLRAALGSRGGWIHTVFKAGYVWNPPEGGARREK